MTCATILHAIFLLDWKCTRASRHHICSRNHSGFAIMSTNYAKLRILISYTWRIALLIIWMTWAVKVTLALWLIRVPILLPLLLLLWWWWWWWLLLLLLLMLLLLINRRLENAQDKILAGGYNSRDLSTLPEERFLLATIHSAANTTTLKVKSWIPLASPPSWTAT